VWTVLCSSSSSISVNQPVVNDAGVSSSARVLLSFVFAHSADAILVAEMRVDKASVPDGVFPLMEEMEKMMELMKEALSIHHSASLLRKQQQQHHHYKHQPETLRFASGIADWS
jgi:hypothetical protein